MKTSFDGERREENSSVRRELKMRVKRFFVDLFERVSDCSKNVNNQTTFLSNTKK
jgi:hypothetical protein